MNKSITFKYYFPEYSEYPEDAISIEIEEYLFDNNKDHCEYIAAQIAEHNFHNEDGWEMDWPAKIALIFPDGEERRYMISIEPIPEFYAKEIKKEG